MADLPNTPIAVVPSETPGGTEFPTLVSITVADLVGPIAANRQPSQVKTRTETLRDRVNLIIGDLNFIETGGPGSLNAFLPRDGGQAMAGAIDMGTNQINNVVDPTAAQDAATKNYVDTGDVPGTIVDGYIGEVKLQIGISAASRVESEFCRVLDSTGTKLLAPANNKVADALNPNGINALDTGAFAANLWYFVFAIGDSTGGNPADELLLSLNPGPPFGASPSLPGGYDLFRRIGSARSVTGPAFFVARKINGVTYYQAITLLATGATGGFTAVSAATRIPITAERGIFLAEMQTITPIGTQELRFSDGGGTGLANSTKMQLGSAGTAVGPPRVSMGDFEIHVSITQTFDWSSSGAAVNGSAVYARGYIEDWKHI